MSIKHKHLNVLDHQPTDAEVDIAEIVINLADGTLWTKDLLGVVMQIGGVPAGSNVIADTTYDYLGTGLHTFHPETIYWEVRLYSGGGNGGRGAYDDTTEGGGGGGGAMGRRAVYTGTITAPLQWTIDNAYSTFGNELPVAAGGDGVNADGYSGGSGGPGDSGGAFQGGDGVDGGGGAGGSYTQPGGSGSGFDGSLGGGATGGTLVLNWGGGGGGAGSGGIGGSHDGTVGVPGAKGDDSYGLYAGSGGGGGSGGYSGNSAGGVGGTGRTRVIEYRTAP